MQYARLTPTIWIFGISVIRLNLLVQCIGPSRHHQANRGEEERRPGEPNEEVALRPCPVENAQDGDGVMALKVVAYFGWSESFFPEVRSRRNHE